LKGQIESKSFDAFLRKYSVLSIKEVYSSFQHLLVCDHLLIAYQG